MHILGAKAPSSSYKTLDTKRTKRSQPIAGQNILHLLFHHVTVVCSLKKGAYPEISHVVFCDNKYRFFLTFYVVDHFLCIALFSALKQTLCACMWFCIEWLAFYSAFLNIYQGWCHMKLLLSWRVLCTPYNHAPCHFMQNYIRHVHACLYVTCYLCFWQNDWDLFCAAAVTQGWNGSWNESAQEADPGEENSPTTPAGTQTRDLSIMSLML